MTPYKIHGNHHGGIHAGKAIVRIEPADARIDIRHFDKITIRAEAVFLEDGTRIDGPEIHGFMEGPGCT